MKERTKAIFGIDHYADKEIELAHIKGYPEPDFDFRNQYKKGDKIYFLRVMPTLGVKEILALTVQSVFARTVTAFETKSACYVIPYKKRNQIFQNRAEALAQYEKIDVKEVN